MPALMVPESYESLSNDDIRNRLKAYNANPGPINDLTRKSYLKKLAQLDADSKGATGDRSFQVASPSVSFSDASNGYSRAADPSPARNRQSRRSVVPTPTTTPAAKSPSRRKTMAAVPTPTASSSTASYVRPPPQNVPSFRDTPDSRGQARHLPESSAPVPRPVSSLRSRYSFSRADVSDTEAPEDADRISGFTRRRTIARPTVSTSAASYEPRTSYLRFSSPSNRLSLPPFATASLQYLRANFNKIVFGVVAVLAVGMFVYSASQRTGTTDSYPVCSPSTMDDVDCVPTTELQEAVENLKKIKTILEKRAFLHDWPACASNPTQAAIASASRGLSDSEIVKEFFVGPTTGTHFAKLRYVAILASVNPHWGVAVTTRDGTRTDDVKFASGLEATRGFLPLGCLAAISIQEFFFRGLVLAAILGVVYIGYYVWRYRARENERRERMVYSFVDKAIMVLASRKNEEPDDENAHAMPVHEIRDYLIKASMRNDPETIDLWKRAVEFIEKKESRVGAETRKIGGYDIRVWYFRGNPATSPAKMTKNKANTDANDSDDLGQDDDVMMSDVAGSNQNEGMWQSLTRDQQRRWQGSAFDNNRLKSSPTPCLKIRNMFDPEMETGDDWPVQIQDALLRRCEGVPIVHVAVDRESKDGTVYMKCLDEDASGRAYNLLHGHWFDGQLVTVKYLLADRYHTRFPQARDVRVPIQPIAR